MENKIKIKTHKEKFANSQKLNDFFVVFLFPI